MDQQNTNSGNSKLNIYGQPLQPINTTVSNDPSQPKRDNSPVANVTNNLNTFSSQTDFTPINTSPVIQSPPVQTNSIIPDSLYEHVSNIAGHVTNSAEAIVQATGDTLNAATQHIGNTVSNIDLPDLPEVDLPDIDI